MRSSASLEFPHPVVVVNAIVINYCGHVLITRRRDNAMWCLPGGYVEFGERLTDAVCREVLEETGVTVSVSQCTGLYSEPNLTLIPPAKVPVIVIAFKCFPISGEPAPSDEVSEARYVAPTELPVMISTHPPRIVDAMQFKGTTRVT